MPKWTLPLQRVEDRSAKFKKRIRRLRAGGGGIYVYTALAEAYSKLLPLKLRRRHIILFSDSADTEQAIGEAGEHVFQLVARMAAKKITISVVAIGHKMDKDLGLLRGISSSGKGRFYFTDDMFSIPRIFAQEAMLSLRQVVIRKPFFPTRSAPSSLLKGLGKVPELHGYIATTARASATVALKALRDDPLLAYGRCGLGRSLAFTSDLAGPWTKEWAAQRGFATLMRQSIRWLIGPKEEPFFSIQESFKSDGLHIVADAVRSDGEFINFVEAEVHCATSSGKVVRAPLVQKGPGRYEAIIPVKGTGVHLLNILRKKDGRIFGSQLHGVVCPYSAEYRGPAFDRRLLRKIAAVTGGVDLSEDFQRAFRRPDKPAYRRVPLWETLVLLALMMWLADIARRRVSFSVLLEFLRKVLNMDHQPVEEGTMGRLRNRKASLLLPHQGSESQMSSMMPPKATPKASSKSELRKVRESLPVETGAANQPKNAEESFTQRLLRAKRATRRVDSNKDND